jgi:hypothetical protein
VLPGAYPHLSRIDEFWEVHRWEPGRHRQAADAEAVVLARVRAMAEDRRRSCGSPTRRRCATCRTRSAAVCRTAGEVRGLCLDLVGRLHARHGDREDSRGARRGMREDQSPHVIGLWGVDMAANEELYTGQRAACQFFMQVLVGLKIEFYVPPESDLCVPPPPYGVSESQPPGDQVARAQAGAGIRLAQTNARPSSAESGALHPGRDRRPRLHAEDVAARGGFARLRLRQEFPGTEPTLR